MPDKKPKSEIVIAREGKVGKISIDGAIGYSYWDEPNSYSAFKRALNGLGDVNIIELYIKSPGGVIVDGSGIANLLREHSATLHTYNMGEAGSMASVLLLAGDKIYIPDNAMTFIHKPLNIVIGNADEMRKKADELDKFEKAIGNIYMKNFKGSDEDLTALMASETWYTADEMSDKFDNVIVVSSGGQKAAAHSEPLEILGDLGLQQECVLDKFVNKIRKNVQGTLNQEVDMPITPEDRKEMVDDITASVVAALKPVEPKEPEAAPVAKIEIAFEGDKSDPVAVQAHAEKLALAKAEAAVDWNDQASVNKHLALITPKKENTPPASAQGKKHEPKKSTDDEPTDEDINGAVDRMCSNAN